MKINWLVDDTIQEREQYGVPSLIKAIEASGHNLHVAKYVPMTDGLERENPQDFGPRSFLLEPTVVYGSHNYAAKAKGLFYPGTYGLSSNFDCSTYYDHVPYTWLLNADHVRMPFGMIYNQFPMVAEQFDTPFFCKPVKAGKLFAGGLMREVGDLMNADRYSRVDGDTMCLVSSAHQLRGEFRFIVVDRKVVTGSCYRWNNVLDIRADYAPEAHALAVKMAEFEWQPDDVYTCDVAMTEDGLTRIIELNGFCSAGLYACDRRAVVDAVSNFAYADFQRRV